MSDEKLYEVDITVADAERHNMEHLGMTEFVEIYEDSKRFENKFGFKLPVFDFLQKSSIHRIEHLSMSIANRHINPVIIIFIRSPRFRGLDFICVVFGFL